MKHNVAVWRETEKLLASILIPLELSSMPTLRNSATFGLVSDGIGWDRMRSMEEHEYEYL